MCRFLIVRFVVFVLVLVSCVVYVEDYPYCKHVSRKKRNLVGRHEDLWLDSRQGAVIGSGERRKYHHLFTSSATLQVFSR